MGWLWGREWPWILLSFLLGAILTWLWMVHKVRREVPRARARTDRDVRTDRDADRDAGSDRDAGRDARSGGAATAVGAGAAGAGVVGAKRDAERATDRREEITKREDVAKREDTLADTTAPQPTAAAAAAPVAKKADADRPAPEAKATPARTPTPDIRKSTAKKRDTELYDQEADADRPGAPSGGASMTGTAAAGTAAAGAAAVGRHEAHDDRDENADKTIRGDQHDAPTEAVPVVPRHEKEAVDHDAPTGEIPVARAHPDRERGAGEQATAGSATDVPSEPATQAPTTAAPAAAAAAASADTRPTTPSAAAARAGSGSSRGHDAARRVADEQDPMVARFGAGAASPKEDGSAPSSEYVIKGNADSMLFHTQDSPRYEATRPEVWFKDEAAATGAGFAHWDRKKRRTGRSGSPSGPAADAPKDAGTASGTAALAAEPATAPAAQPTEAAPASPPAAQPTAAPAAQPTEAPATEPDPMTEQFGPAAASPKEGGAPPSDEYTVKGNSDSMLFHTSDSPGFRATVAEVWFKDEESARAAGFRHWDHRRR